MHALPGWPVWQAIGKNGKVGVSVFISKGSVCLAEEWKDSLKASELYLIRLKILPSSFNSDKPTEGGAQTPHLGLGWLMEPRSLRCRVLLHPRVSSGSVGLAVQDATSVRESLVPTFAYLYSSAVPSPPLLCLCSINLQNRARLVISPWSLFLLISVQNRSTWTLLFQSLMCSPCQAVVQATRFALNGTRQWNLFFIYRLHCQERKHLWKRQQENANVELLRCVSGSRKVYGKYNLRRPGVL